MTKLFVLIFILLNISFSTAKGIDKEFQLPEIVFDELITLSANDNDLFEKSFKRLFIPEYPEYPDYFLCGVVIGAYKPQFKYTFSFQKSVESWTPLFDNYNVTSYWLVTL